MHTAQQTLDQSFHEMRWRCLSLAADFDRIQRGEGAKTAFADPRIAQLREALKLLLIDDPDRAQRVQMIFSDQTPGPSGGTNPSDARGIKSS
ncbi:MAG TPA: hypothetical protein VF669_10985 [Tepidisphaeraceae bacterium]